MPTNVILKAKCTQFDFCSATGLSQTQPKELAALPDSLAIFKGHTCTSKGRRKEDERRRRGEVKGKGGRGEEDRKGRAVEKCEA